MLYRPRNRDEKLRITAATGHYAMAIGNYAYAIGNLSNKNNSLCRFLLVMFVSFVTLNTVDNDGDRHGRV